jgi:tetratricopeptide (TPR) repeat protein
MTKLQQKLTAAMAAHRAGDLVGATQSYREVLAEQPEHADALHMLGVIAQQKGNPELGLKLIEAALAKQPGMALAWCNRSLVLRVLERYDEALESARQAMAIDPNLADGFDMAGTILHVQGKLSEACHMLKRAVTLQPENVRFQSNYAALLLATGDLAGAYRAVRETERLDPQFVPYALANVLKAAGYPERAIPYFHKSFEMMPHYLDANANEAMAWLQIGELEYGWDLWEKRADMGSAYQILPLWTGAPVRHLLIYEDQGFGDIIQCLRYIPMIERSVETITIHVAKPLQKLVAAHCPDICVLSADDALPAADARSRFMSLPYLLKTNLATIPPFVPVLVADHAWRAPWPKRLGAVPRPRVGLVWGGNPANHNDVNRSLPFSQLAPLLKVGAPHMVSLQKGVQKSQANLPPVGVFDADPFLSDFADMAGLLAEIDLLISVDTAGVHLAGAMGKPVWLLVPFDNDWRWLIGREDSPWYPSVRIFRQQKPGAWDDVIREVALHLHAFIAGDNSVVKPHIWPGPPLRQNPNAVPLPD